MLPVERRRYTDSLSKALYIVTLGNMSPGDIKKTKQKKTTSASEITEALKALTLLKDLGQKTVHMSFI